MASTMGLENNTTATIDNITTMARTIGLQNNTTPTNNIITTMASTMGLENHTTSTNDNVTDTELGWIGQSTHWFCLWGMLYVIIALIAVVGNGMVLYASYGNKNTGRLQYLDSLIKSLAVTDMLYGLIGIPCRILNTYLLGQYIPVISKSMSWIKPY